MRCRIREQGEGRTGFVVALIVTSLTIFAGVKFVPVYVGAYDLRETIRLEVSRASMKKDEHIVDAVLAKAHESGLPVTKKDIQVTRTHAKFFMKVKDYPKAAALLTAFDNLDATHKPAEVSRVIKAMQGALTERQHAEASVEKLFGEGGQ